MKRAARRAPVRPRGRGGRLRRALRTRARPAPRPAGARSLHRAPTLPHDRGTAPANAHGFLPPLRRAARSRAIGPEGGGATMAIGLKTPGLHHLSLRSTDLERSKGFYVGLLGFPVVMEVLGLLLFAAGSALFGARGPTRRRLPATASTPSGWASTTSPSSARTRASSSASRGSSR